MTFAFKPAVRTETSLLIALAGASGSGKTFSGLRLATGLAGGGKIAAIDTEAGRMLHYAGQFAFDHGDLKPPFTPEAYMEAIVSAEEAGYRVIVIDSFSHEYEGEGGLQDIQAAELDRMCTDDRTGKIDKRKMERLTAPAWKLPKLRHKRLVNRLLQCRAHLIFCLRAEEKIRFEKVKDERGYERTAIVPAGWVPICEKRFMYEMTVSMNMLPDAPGVPVPVKIQEQHRAAFPDGERVSENAGAYLSAWAKGGTLEGSGETVLDGARTAAGQGSAALQAYWSKLSAADRKAVSSIKDELTRLRDAADAQAASPDEAVDDAWLNPPPAAPASEPVAAEPEPEPDPAPSAPPDEPSHDPATGRAPDETGPAITAGFEDWFAGLSARATQASNLADLDNIWEADVQPHRAGLIPPDRDALDNLYGRHRKRLVG